MGKLRKKSLILETILWCQYKQENRHQVAVLTEVDLDLVI